MRAAARRNGHEAWLTKKPGIDKELIRDLAALLKETELSEIEIEQDDFRIRVVARMPRRRRRRSSMPSRRGRPQRSACRRRRPSRRNRSPIRRGIRAACPRRWWAPSIAPPSPNAKPFVEVGDRCSVGQTILIVEAMKHMNEVAAPRAGKVSQILVEDGQPVEYGEPLMIIE